MGGGFMLQPGAFRPPPVLRPFPLPVPGFNPAVNMPSMVPSGRPLLPPMGTSTGTQNGGYVAPPGLRPPLGGPQGNGLPLPPTTAVPASAPGVRPANTTALNSALPGPPGSYQQQPGNIPPTYSFASASIGAPGGYSQQQSSFTPSLQVNHSLGSVPGAMPPGEFQSSQGVPTTNSYGMPTGGGLLGHGG